MLQEPGLLRSRDTLRLGFSQNASVPMGSLRPGGGQDQPRSPYRCPALWPSQSLSRAGPPGRAKCSQGGAGTALGTWPGSALGVGGRCGQGLNPALPGAQEPETAPRGCACPNDTWCLGRAHASRPVVRSVDLEAGGLDSSPGSGAGLRLGESACPALQALGSLLSTAGKRFHFSLCCLVAVWLCH